MAKRDSGVSGMALAATAGSCRMCFGRSILHAKEMLMSNRTNEQHPHSHDHKGEAQIDQAVEDTFPASDPPSTGGKTRIEPDKSKTGGERDDHRDQHDQARHHKSH
jgi:hypothetical protein